MNKSGELHTTNRSVSTSRRYALTIKIGLIQYLGPIFGVPGGLALVRLNPFHESMILWTIAGVVSVFLLGSDCRSRWICAALASLAIYIMITEPFLWCNDGSTLVYGILLLTPFILGVGPMVRSNAWSGVVGATLFVTVSLAMLTRNVFSKWSGVGFFHSWIF
jgi:hypothetical protein